MFRFRVNPYAVMASIHAVKSRVRKVWKPVLFVFIMLFNPAKHLSPFIPKAKREHYAGAWTYPIYNMPKVEHAIYEGETLGGKFMHGQGKLTLADGTSYEGEFNFSDLTHGKISYPDYSVYEGPIAKWKEQGMGKITHADGNVETRSS